MSESINITFTRKYTIDKSVIHGALIDKNYEDVEMTSNVMIEEAEKIAKEFLLDEMNSCSIDTIPISTSIEVLWKG